MLHRACCSKPAYKVNLTDFLMKVGHDNVN